MPLSLPLVASLLLASVSLHTLAFILYCQERPGRERQVTALVILSLGAAFLALASLLWLESRFATMTPAPAPVSTYAEHAPGGLGVEQRNRP
jgi:hypothetical protein